MPSAKIYIPILLLAIQVLMKFFVGRKIDGRICLESLCELPTNIIFLAISFSVIYISTHEPVMQAAMMPPLFLFCVAFIVVFLFRLSKGLLDDLKAKTTIALFLFLILVNFILSIYCLSITSEKLLEKVDTSISKPPHQTIPNK